MRKRRVGVTARSRLVVWNLAMGTTQTETEIAAPLVSRTPQCTSSADGSMAILLAWRGNRAEDQKDNRGNNGPGESDRRADARMRRCLILRQGDKPPETPGPLSLGLDYTEGRKSVKGSLRRQNQPPLTDFLPSETTHPDMRERGPQERALVRASRWSAVRLAQSRRQPT